MRAVLRGDQPQRDLQPLAGAGVLGVEEAGRVLRGQGDGQVPDAGVIGGAGSRGETEAGAGVARRLPREESPPGEDQADTGHQNGCGSRGDSQRRGECRVAVRHVGETAQEHQGDKHQEEQAQETERGQRGHGIPFGARRYGSVVGEHPVRVLRLLPRWRCGTRP